MQAVLVRDSRTASSQSSEVGRILATYVRLGYAAVSRIGLRNGTGSGLGASTLRGFAFRPAAAMSFRLGRLNRRRVSCRCFVAHACPSVVSALPPAALAVPNVLERSGEAGRLSSRCCRPNSHGASACGGGFYRMPSVHHRRPGATATLAEQFL